MNIAAEGGDIFEPRAFSKKARDFDVGIYSVFEFSVKLKEELIGVEH